MAGELFERHASISLAAVRRPPNHLHAAEAPASHEICVRKFAACLVRG